MQLNTGTIDYQLVSWQQNHAFNMLSVVVVSVNSITVSSDSSIEISTKNLAEFVTEPKTHNSTDGSIKHQLKTLHVKCTV